MLTEFETRLVEVLGARLPAPYAGRVVRAGDPKPGGNGPVVRVGISATEPLLAELAASRPEVVPGNPDRRRVLRLGVTLDCAVAPPTNGGRGDALRGLDAVLFALDAADLRTGAALRPAGPADPGFQVDAVQAGAGRVGDDTGVTVRAEGWFWPVGAPGEEGGPIESVLIRELPIEEQP